jgi:hypothetical protein
VSAAFIWLGQRPGRNRGPIAVTADAARSSRTERSAIAAAGIARCRRRDGVLHPLTSGPGRLPWSLWRLISAFPPVAGTGSTARAGRRRQLNRPALACPRCGGRPPGASARRPPLRHPPRATASRSGNISHCLPAAPFLHVHNGGQNGQANCKGRIHDRDRTEQTPAGRSVRLPGRRLRPGLRPRPARRGATSGRIAVSAFAGCVTIVLLWGWIRLIRRPSHLEISPETVTLVEPDGKRTTLSRASGGEITVTASGGGRYRQRALTIVGSGAVLPLGFFDLREIQRQCVASGWQFHMSARRRTG